METSRPTHLRRLWAEVEPKLLGAAFLVVVACWGFVEIVDGVLEGETRAVDEWILEHVREQWVVSDETVIAEVAENLTALGGVPVLGLAVVVVLGYILLRRQYRRAIYLAVVTGGGSLAAYILKFAFDRPRPTIVEPLDVTATASFPSGHSMSAAVVYLTLAALIAAGESRRTVKLYVIGVAFLVTVLVGLSRILLAVHYPTDVLAGWIAGLAWAVGCWIGWSMWGEPSSDAGESGESD